MHLRFVAQRQLRVGSRKRPRDIDALAGLEPPNSRANGNNLASGIGTRCEWKLARPIFSGTDIRFNRVDANCFETNQNLSVAGLRVGKLFKFQDLRTSELMHANRFHLSPTRSWHYR